MKKYLPIKNKEFYSIPFCCIMIFYAMLLITSCSKEEYNIESKPEILNKRTNGLVINQLDSTPIPDLEVVLVTKYTWSGDGGSSVSTLTNHEGKFRFYTGGHIKLWGDEYWKNYQGGIWVNGEFQSTQLLGIYPEFNPDTPFEVTFGLYPNTYFKIITNNVEPAAETDKIIFDIQNMDRGGQYEVIGIPQDTLIEGKTRFENILIIEYDVVTDSGTEHYKKVIACEPGGMTEIEIEY